MNRTNLQELSKTRIKEARVLLDKGYPAGAYYLCGYSIECALKACVASQTKEHDFPDKQMAQKSHTHNLVELFSLSGFYQDFKTDWQSYPKLELNWGIVSNWSEISRYTLDNNINDAKDIYRACVSPRVGVLSWIRNRW